MLDATLSIFPQTSRIRRKLSRLRKFCFVVTNWQWSQGLHLLGERVHKGRFKWLFVSRGIASHRNMRLFCPPEIALITLVHQNPHA